MPVPIDGHIYKSGKKVNVFKEALEKRSSVYHTENIGRKIKNT